MILPEVSQAPTDPRFVQNPYPFYKRLREIGPWVIWKDYGIACATRLSVVNAVLRDRRFGRENPFPAPTPEHLAPFYRLEANSMLEREPPAHTRLRGLVMRAFTTRKVAGLAPDIDALANKLLDTFSSDEVDLLPTFCEKIPVIIICRLLGVPEEMAPQLLSWSHAMVAMYEARRDRAIEDDAVRATLEFETYMHGLIAERRRRPGDDLLTDLIAAEENGDRLTLDEMVATCILLLNAGHEATVHALGNGIKAISEADLALDIMELPADGLTEEVLRFDPPLHLFMRYAMEDFEFGDMFFKKGTQIGVLLGCANHDAQAYPHPERFDPRRAQAAHVSLGAGHHFCVGAPLARLEIARSLPVIFRRFPQLHLSEKPHYADRYHFRGLKALKVRLTA